MCFLVELSVGQSASATTGQLAEGQDSVVALHKSPLWTTEVSTRTELQQHCMVATACSGALPHCLQGLQKRASAFLFCAPGQWIT